MDGGKPLHARSPGTEEEDAVEEGLMSDVIEPHTLLQLHTLKQRRPWE